MKKVLMWFFAILFILISFEQLMSIIEGYGLITVITPLCFFLVGIFLIPPINYKIKLPIWVKFIIVLGLLMMSSIL